MLLLLGLFGVALPGKAHQLSSGGEVLKVLNGLRRGLLTETFSRQRGLDRDAADDELRRRKQDGDEGASKKVSQGER